MARTGAGGVPSEDVRFLRGQIAAAAIVEPAIAPETAPEADMSGSVIP